MNKDNINIGDIILRTRDETIHIITSTYISKYYNDTEINVVMNPFGKTETIIDISINGCDHVKL